VSYYSDCDCARLIDISSSQNQISSSNPHHYVSNPVQFETLFRTEIAFIGLEFRLLQNTERLRKLYDPRANKLNLIMTTERCRDAGGQWKCLLLTKELMVVVETKS